MKKPLDLSWFHTLSHHSTPNHMGDLSKGSSMSLSQDELKRLVHYDPWTGFFFWRANDGKKRKGKIAGSVNKVSGYVEIRINGQLYYGHRLAWFYEHGVWPKELLDHEDLNRRHNAKFNLREASFTQNARNSSRSCNNRSGFKGVYRATKGSTFHASITVNGKGIFLGAFQDPVDAAKAYDTAALTHHGKFARTNKELGLL